MPAGACLLLASALLLQVGVCLLLGGLAMWRSFEGKGRLKAKCWNFDTAGRGAPVFSGLRTEVEPGSEPVGRTWGR